MFIYKGCEALRFSIHDKQHLDNVYSCDQTNDNNPVLQISPTEKLYWTAMHLL